MSAKRLTAQLIVYYAIIFTMAYAILTAWPDFEHYLPIGGAEELINPEGKSSVLQSVAESQNVKSLGQSIGWLAVAILGSLLCAIPVSWTYLATRTTEEYDQSLISSILILPVVVTSIVVVVQNSLALAFALGGIAGAVRFKNSLKSSGDALYILLSVGIGLASGIGAVELAMLMGLAFNACFVILWITEYGEREGMKRFMTDFDPSNSPPPAAAAADPAAPQTPPSSTPPPAI
jgi:ABC-type sulfate transport system permease component